MSLEGFPLQLSITCSGCRQPLPVNGISGAAFCNHCGTTVTLDQNFWTEVLEDEYFAEALEYEPGEGREISMWGGVEAKLAFGRRLPRCQSCQTDIDPNILPQAADYGALQCYGCGEHIKVRHADDLTRSILPQALYLVNEGVTGDSAQERMGASQPVQINCVQCGAGLQADGSSRTVSCIYCQADNYLPDGVWFRIHPVSKVQTFFLVAQYTQEQRLMAQLASDEGALAVAGRNDLSAEAARQVAQHDDSDVREKLALNQSVPPEVLAEMASDRDSDVRENLGKNPATSPETLTALLNDSAYRVRAAAARNSAAESAGGTR